MGQTRAMGMLPRRARQPDAVALLGALGTREGRPIVEAFCARGSDALIELLDWLQRRVRFHNDAHVADFSADLDHCLGRLARAHPKVFLAAVEQAPKLLDHSAVLAAAGRLPGERTTAWLLDALDDANAERRRSALALLLARADPEVIPRLRGLLRDRSAAVRFEAADGLRRWGGPDDIDELWRYQKSAPLGGAERALDAIESICARAGGPLPPEHPGPRLIDIELPLGAIVEPNLEALMVARGALLATSPSEEIRAPCDGQVVALDADREGRVRVVLRRPG